MSDGSIRQRISDLVHEEHTLRDKLSSHEISAAEEHARLRDVEVELDQCWDLLRRRRAARGQGQDPDSVETRDKQQVESYLQ